MDLPRFSPAQMDHEFCGRPGESDGRLLISLRMAVYAVQGTYTVGRGGVGIPSPMKKLGCGGWL
jgi:hypothetical protein